MFKLWNLFQIETPKYLAHLLQRMLIDLNVPTRASNYCNSMSQ